MPIDSCTEKVALFFSANDLPKLDITSGTDAFAVIYDLLGKTGSLNIVAHTITIRLYDQDGGYDQTQLDKHQFIGEYSFQLTQLMCTPGQKLSGDLQSGRGRGAVVVRAEAAANTDDVFVAKFVGKDLINTDGFFGCSDPFLVINRIMDDRTWMKVWQNERMDNTRNPAWPMSYIPMTALCNGDIDRPIKIEVWDHQSNGKHQFMGCSETTVRSLLGHAGNPFNVIEPEKKKKKASYLNSGTLTAVHAEIERHPTFSQFIVGGCEISLVVAIDFTGSNGDPSSPQSLHYIDRSGGGRLNEYQHAILSVGSVLEPYDSDKLYPVYGFGARVRGPDGEFTPVQHSFPVYGGGLHVPGVHGIMQAYAACVEHVMLSGPTLLAPIIQAAARMAKEASCSQEKQKYMVLLILTDGVFNDMAEVIAAIVEASEQPLSIAIVGVGSADFADMRALEGGGIAEPLKSGDKVAKRNIVQFLRYADLVTTTALSKHVLEKIPKQLLQYMELHQPPIMPHAPKGERRATAAAASAESLAALPKDA